MRTPRRTIIKIIGNFFEEISTSLLCKFLNLSLLLGMLSGNSNYSGLTVENQQRQILKNHYIKIMDGPSEINSVYWDESTKSWKYKMISVEEYHGFVECQHCRKPMSHNVKSDGEFKVVYVKCGCTRDGF